MNATDGGPAHCAHTPCQCGPRPGDAYCSEFCKHAATSGPPREEPVCACGHADCKTGKAGATATA